MRSFSNIMTNFAGNLHLLVDSIHKIISVFQKKDFVRMVWGNTEIFVPLHQQKEEIQKKGQRRIRRASHGCLSIVIEGQHPRCSWCSIFVPRLS